jgi:LuxR family transcriptional regulator, maltose regulon positive regulatory protein
VGLDLLLETKLHAPAARAEWVARAELIARLAGADVKLVLVAAPAGFGKTTLVAQWQLSPAESRPFAWISLDPGDNDPGRLWWHVACALQRACPGFSADDVLALVRGQPPDFAGTLLPLLINELAKLTEPVVLVLDDCQVITEPDCHDQLAFLLLHLPPTVQLVLLTRADPPLPLGRVRATGELAEIGAHELRFAPAHAAELVAAVAGIALSPADLAELVDRTEGWPAGIYLAALLLHGRPSAHDVIRQFSGESRFVEKFLAEEVLGRQRGNVRQFLLRTSILGRFCAPLCDAVTGSADAAEIIGILERGNLFVVPLDGTRQWFRYHHLFAEMLRAELSRAEPEIVPVLHERARAWHRRSGSTDEAISHASSAGDVAGVIDLMARHWYGYVDSGQVATVRRWLSLLGDGIVSAEPLAAHCAAWAAALSGDQESLRRWLPLVKAGEYQGALPDGIRSLRSSAALLQGTFGFEGIGRMRAAAAEAVALETDPVSPWHALARISYASALYLSGDFDAAAVQAQHALPPEAPALIRVLGFAVLSLIAVDRGELDEAEQWAGTAQDILARADPGLSAAPQVSLAFTAAGEVAARRGRLIDARWDFERALESRRGKHGISPWPTLELLLRFAPVLSDLGDRSRAVALLTEARSILVASPDGAEAQFARLDRIERRLAARPRSIMLGAPLTEREAAVLRLLRGSLSLREIGQELFLSPNTIKTHTQAIYRKLGVSTRHDAVARGHDIDIF